jgi:hypothetical protein
MKGLMAGKDRWGLGLLGKGGFGHGNRSGVLSDYDLSGAFFGIAESDMN